jgi:hypothetical protein
MGSNFSISLNQIISRTLKTGTSSVARSPMILGSASANCGPQLSARFHNGEEVKLSSVSMKIQIRVSNRHSERQLPQCSLVISAAQHASQADFSQAPDTTFGDEAKMMTLQLRSTSEVQSASTVVPTTQLSIILTFLGISENANP